MTSSKNSGKFLQQGYGVSHNETLGIQGGDSLGRYHLTPAEYAALAYLGTTNHWTGINTFDNFTATGTPTVPTAAVDTNTTQIASTAYVIAQGYLKAATAVSTYAPLASPALTGNPTVPTQSYGDASTKIANTQFVSDAVVGAKSSMGLYLDSPVMNMCVIRNPKMDNSLPTNGRQVFPKLTSGAFTASMIGRKFKCTNAGSSTRDFRQGTTALLRTIGTSLPYTVTDVLADTALTLNTYYWVIAAGTPDNWGGTELTPVDSIIEIDKWYIVKDNSITYNSISYPASTYDPYYSSDPAGGGNLSPSVFKGTSAGGAYFTGTGNVYELEYMVVESSTGNGTTSGTITLNWVPDIYDIFNPTVGKEWALKAIYPRDKTLKITGGDYSTKTLNFVVSGPGGYTSFSAVDFPQGKMVSLYNPFNSTFDVDFSTRILPLSRPSYANKYVVANTLFKRKTDGLFCGIVQCLATSDSKSRLGYYTSADFSSQVTLSAKPILDGKLTNTYISSGTLTSGSKYKVVTTETNHFGTEVVVGDYIVSAGTETCNASNTVRKVDDYWFYNAFMGQAQYIGETSDGKYIWEAPCGFVAKSGTPQTTHCFVQFDETFSDQYLKVIDIDMNRWFGDTDDYGTYDYYYANYTYYDGKHRLTMYGVTPNLYTTPRPTWEYISTAGKYGPYTTRDTIHIRDITNDAYPCSRDIEVWKYFTYNSKLWALVSGTSMSSYCGFDANKRQLSLYRYSDTTGTWKIDSRSPVLITPIYATSTLWGSDYEWAQVHLGGGLAFYIEGGVMYLNISAEESTNTYDICYGTLDLRALGPS